MKEKDSGATFDLFSDARPETPDFLSVPADLHAAGPDQAVGQLMLDNLRDLLVDDGPVVTFPDD